MNTGFRAACELLKRNGRLISAIIFGVLFVFLSVPGLCSSSPVNEQAETLIEKALDEYEKANYVSAIDYLKQALVKSPNNAEIYYYLGHFLHYLCYDSTPLTDYGMNNSDDVLRYLQKAVELDPQLGNAYYFIGAEYGVRARHAMRQGMTGDVIEQFQKGKSSGGYPEWLVEYGRNILRSCEQDAILIVHGDAETNPIEYLQCVEHYRTDISVIPSALLEEPWFIALLKTGLDGCLKPVSISWSEDQIFSMRPYKWKPNTICIPVSDIPGHIVNDEPADVEWLINPNLGRGEKLEFLSAGRAALVDIVRTNQWKRPIHFSLGCPQSVWEGLEPYMQTRGLIKCVLPYNPESDFAVAETRAFLLD